MGQRFLHYLKYFSVIFLVVLLAVAGWMWKLNTEIQQRLSHGWFRPPIELYSRGETFRVKSILHLDELADKLRIHHYRERFEEQALYPGDFAILNTAQCSDMAHDSFLGDLAGCVTFVTQKPTEHYLIAIDPKYQISHVFAGTPPREQPSAALEPELYAQFFSGQPILRTIIHIGDAPLECLQATTAIEDHEFLEHRGVSATGFLRAVARNIIARGYAQGGSTITQQLVKNYFLTPEKTVRRKIQDMMMAILLEANLDKDQILENYLNVNYMGQRGPFQVIGFGAAAEHYIGKKLGDLDLPECALLAAIINNPGKYDPATHPDNALKRRALVLDHMAEYGMITLAQAEGAKKAELPPAQERLLKEPAPYYTQAIFRELERLQIAADDGLRVYTALDIHAQDFAQKKILAHVENLEKTNKNIEKLKGQGHVLESSLISVDVATGEVIALVGGRQFVKTQYNRVLDAHRQVGSIMKPFVYLTALENRNTDGSRFLPTTLIDDVQFVYSYEGQKWSPRNYEKEFNGPVPLFYALKMSLNAATAKLGLQVGLNNIIDVARRAGVSQSEIKPLPSLTLGAFEIFPWEVATSYLTFARFGERMPLEFIKRVENVDGTNIYTSEPKPERVFAPETVAVLVGMMKQTLRTGTARLPTKLSGFTWPAAGKTGTTSDLHDTWFGGFTPHLLTITWTGFDDNTPTTLTGATGALPLWLEFMKAVAVRFPPDDFQWPDSVEKISLSPEQYKELVPHAADYELAEPTELIKMK